MFGEKPERLGHGERGLESVSGRIEFEGVTFSYPGRPPVLERFSLAIEAGETLARANRRLGYTRLTAPLEGNVAEVSVDLNEVVARGQTIARLTSGDRVEVEVAIPGSLISRIENGDAVTVGFNALAGRTFPATVAKVGVASVGNDPLGELMTEEFLENVDADLAGGLGWTGRGLDAKSGDAGLGEVAQEVAVV